MSAHPASSPCRFASHDVKVGRDGPAVEIRTESTMQTLVFVPVLGVAR